VQCFLGGCIIPDGLSAGWVRYRLGLKKMALTGQPCCWRVYTSIKTEIPISFKGHLSDQIETSSYYGNGNRSCPASCV